MAPRPRIHAHLGRHKVINGETRETNHAKTRADAGDARKTVRLARRIEFADGRPRLHSHQPACSVHVDALHAAQVERECSLLPPFPPVPPRCEDNALTTARCLLHRGAKRCRVRGCENTRRRARSGEVGSRLKEAAERGRAEGRRCGRGGGDCRGVPGALDHRGETRGCGWKQLPSPLTLPLRLSRCVVFHDSTASLSLLLSVNLSTNTFLSATSTEGYRRIIKVSKKISDSEQICLERVVVLRSQDPCKEAAETEVNSSI
eukprot:scaffold265757_cov31-Tisochrysis_lutea.AAC.3